MQRKDSRKERRNIRMNARAKVNPYTCKMKKRRDETKGVDSSSLPSTLPYDLTPPRHLLSIITCLVVCVCVCDS